jgi:hypothetical protein
MRRLAVAGVAAAALFGSAAPSAHAREVPGPCATSGAVLNELGIQMIDLYIWPYYVTCRTLG